jgi:hypothetical protein
MCAGDLYVDIRYPVFFIYLPRAVTWGFGLVVRAVDWHADDPGSFPGRDGLYTFGCIPYAQRFESASAEILRYIKTLIYFIYFYPVTNLF